MRKNASFSFHGTVYNMDHNFKNRCMVSVNSAEGVYNHSITELPCRQFLFNHSANETIQAAQMSYNATRNQIITAGPLENTRILSLFTL